jgi:putative flavoprotein involved in K+ transport
MHDVVIVGAGAAGVGVGVALRKIGFDESNFVVIDRREIGASFRSWPAEMRFISPSFNSNPFGLIDLNAVTPDTSPAFSLRNEHPSGADYARYLEAVANHFELPVRTGVDVTGLTPTDDGCALQTSQGELATRFVVWAAGEFQYPRRDGFDGASLCVHNAAIQSWPALPGKAHVVIGGYESGIDAAVNLSALGRTVRVIDSSTKWADAHSDPSISLSPYTLERLRRARKDRRIELIGGVRVLSVTKTRGTFAVTLDNGERLTSPTPPILATGFQSSARVIADAFDWRDDGQPALSDVDESTRTQGVFFAGPGVRHGEQVFCFIYKFRQRFAVIANEIGVRLGHDTSGLEIYRQSGMFLDDLSCCGAACAC